MKEMAGSPGSSPICSYPAPMADPAVATACQPRSAGNAAFIFTMIERREKAIPDITVWLEWFLAALIAPSPHRRAACRTTEKAQSANGMRRHRSIYGSAG